MKKVAVGLSGGVDSAVALYILKEKGFETAAFFADNFDCKSKGHDNSCCSPEGLQRARETALFLNVPFYRMDFRDEFRRIVMEPFVKNYNAGITPNPCIWCNAGLRFSIFLNRLKSIGFDYMATGHYAGLRGERLFMASDKSKDQSYFLYSVDRNNFRNVIFPLSGFKKSSVRKLARQKKLPAKDARESQDSCILSEKTLKEYLQDKTLLREGDIVDGRGNVLGRHQGYQNYTIGQRVRLGGMGTKLYVSDILPEENKIKAEKKENLYLNEVCFRYEENKFFAAEGEKLKAKLRSAQKPADCVIEKLYLSGNICKIRFSGSVWAPAPGQSAVLYRGQQLVGGGEILK
ncbi:MAG: tRNA 2-thiouridine(34) synthase MnmA [Elusimicrobiota bacterium]